ncbi:XRE family transcriptional regulator [Streptomyces sp. NPDC020801]|uniref:XRE family transcriptional regulator n=1 Tax=Streptomyces sp. NPDC020801 TaxID=3365093 RepID=UPI00379ED0CD
MPADDARERTELSDLVRTRMAELGLSYRRLEEICVDPEAVAGDQAVEPLWRRGTLENLAKGRRIKPPDFPMLRALAAGLQVTLRQVQEAAGAQFLGIDTVWSPDGRTRVLIEGFRDMDPEDQAKVLALMESRRRLRRD